MYVVLLNFAAPLDQVDNFLPDHAVWLAEHYAAGNFLASGRRHTRDGDVIIARAMPRGRLDAILACDPLAVRRLVHHEILEFQASRTSPALAAYAEPVK
ncbi:YciI family protein [Streptoalloteichus hindustanus]|uniref:Uncharacterized conserved protein YciI, contains a putative active-site phosphohistidine n=1 Tax=Streptoalloteichus hindustanus TaxID=2017 RepID=A0A1M5IYM6_STRHI|nr:YciI family protein [Streptoalloteichus hindustanus]SHG33468.1 Uncharacterized conserved protein YciI, contains a putative active-site phosphohistidine [Streptoalloteichus hindustanus]